MNAATSLTTAVGQSDIPSYIGMVEPLAQASRRLNSAIDMLNVSPKTSSWYEPDMLEMFDMFVSLAPHAARDTLSSTFPHCSKCKVIQSKGSVEACAQKRHMSCCWLISSTL